MMIEPGSQIELSYPDSTLVDSLARLVKRRVHVYRVRDLLAQPLTPDEFLRRPFIRRSRWLISGYDLDRQRYRQFYLGNSAEHRAPGLLKVGLYEPGADRPTWPLPRPFGPTRAERQFLIDVIKEWAKKGPTQLQLRIYSDDLRVHLPPPSEPFRPVARLIRSAG
jgi:hypothetical protein